MRKSIICILILVLAFCGCASAQLSGRRYLSSIEQMDSSTDVPEIVTTITIEKKHESKEIMVDTNQYEQIDTMVIERGIFAPGYSYKATDSVIITTKKR